MKLEVGMYVRTKKGIKRIYTIDNNKTKYKYLYKLKKQDGDGCIDCGALSSEDILKAGHNIIGLIEVGDYVNKYPVYEIIEYEDSTRAIVIGDDNKSIIWEESSQYIKSIVTKEQFESMAYKVDYEKNI